MGILLVCSIRQRECLIAFVGDSVLSEAELDRQNLPRTEFLQVPEVPLTCEYYGLMLPDNDPQWCPTVNQFCQAGIDFVMLLN